MLKVGLTGGIGSGKSTVAKIFELLQVPVYYADYEAKLILDNNDFVRTEIIKNFGNLYKSGFINRQELANIVFKDKSELHKLNSIVHPQVAIHYENWCKKNKAHKYTIKEAAILFESGVYKEMDKIITVVASVDLRIERVCKRDNISKDKVLERIKNQMDDETKVLMSDFIVSNNDTELIIPQILHIHKYLSV